MLESLKKHLGGKQSTEDVQLKTYQNILEKDPKNLNIRLKLGDLYAKLGHQAAAIQEYTVAAVDYANDGFLIKAIAVNKLIVRLDPARQEALDRLSDLYFQRGVAADPLVQNYRHAKEQQEQAPADEIEIPTIELPVSPGVSASAPELSEQQTDAAVADALLHIPLLANLAEETRQWLARHASLRHFHAHEVIIRQDDEQDALYLIRQGHVKLYTKDKENHETLLDTLEVGAFFGATSLFVPLRQNQHGMAEHQFTVIAEDACEILEIPQTALAALVKKDPDLSEALLMAYYKLKTSDLTLARVPLFSFLDPIERRKIAERLRPVNARKGTVLIQEGEMGESMYLLKAGQVGVYTTLMEEEGVSVLKSEQERLHLATLQEGDFFGEQALITREPRSATIIALTDVQLLQFTKQDLALVVKHYPRVGALLKKYHQQRVSNTLESLKSIW